MHTAPRARAKIIGLYIGAILLTITAQRCLMATGALTQSQTTQAQPSPVPNKTAPIPAPTPPPYPWEAASDAIPMVWADPAAGVFYYPGEGHYGDPTQGQCMSILQADQAGCHPAVTPP